MLNLNTRRGFTLIEMLVSVAIFSIVMVIALGSLLAMSESDRKAQSLKSVINNLNFSLDAMSRSIRTGINYHCGTTGTLTNPFDCPIVAGVMVPDTYFTYKTADGVVGAGDSPILNAQVTYCLGTVSPLACNSSGNTILRSINGGTFSPLTAPEVKITTLAFYVKGAPSGDNIQPKVTILISGSVSANGTQSSPFNLQTTVTQRLYDQ